MNQSDKEIINEMYCENDAELRKQEEYNMDVISMVQALLIARFRSGENRSNIKIADFYRTAKEFVDYGVQHFPTNLT